MERELFIHRNQIQHPETLMNGDVMMLEGDVADKIQLGDPTKGWEGDPRLVLAWNRRDQRIELWRRERDEHYHLVLRGKPGKRVVDMGIIDFLVSNDVRRGFNVEKYVNEHNDAVKRNDPSNDRVAAATEKLLWAIKKDTGA